MAYYLNEVFLRMTSAIRKKDWTRLFVNNANQPPFTFVCPPEDLIKTRDGMFEDVVDDFSQVDSVKKRLEDWKTQYGDTYR